MRIWAYVSQKGGSGKSTLSTQTAVYAEECGEAVCLIDLDPQKSSLAWSQIRGSRVPAVQPATPDQVPDLIAAAGTLGATLMLIDTAPHTNTGALAAIRAADLIICPTQPTLFDIAALKDTVGLLNNAERIDRAIAVVNGLPHKGTEDAYGEAVVAVQSLGLRVAKSHIGHRRAFVVAIGKGKGVTELSKKEGALAAQEIKDLWGELNQLSPIVTKKTKRARVS
jgi:chromosome partitioning protein